MTTAVLCGGVGAAKFLSGLVRVVDPSTVTAIVNVGDDTELHGLHISPDIDTVTYTVAGAIDTERGWGLSGETWQAMGQFGRFGNPTWFNLGDRDLATHIVRTERLRNGSALSTVTAEMATSWDLDLCILPVTDGRLRTIVDVVDEGPLSFQEYFVGRQHGVPISAVHFDGAAETTPAPGVIEAIATADCVVIAPSNPIVSIGPLLAVPGVREAVRAARDRVVAISPIVGGAALKGPAARMLIELGYECSVVGIARLYADVTSTLVIDHADAALADEVRECGIECVVTDTIMSDPGRAARLATETIGTHAR